MHVPGLNFATLTSHSHGYNGLVPIISLRSSQCANAANHAWKTCGQEAERSQDKPFPPISEKSPNNVGG